MRPFFEELLALDTLIWTLSGVLALMLRENLSPCEGCAAFLTLIWSFTCVHEVMSCKMRLDNE